MKSLLKYLPVLALCAAVSCRTAHEGPAYLDKSLPAEERAADLLKRLTLEEKGTLMKNQSEAVPRLGIKAYNPPYSRSRWAWRHRSMNRCCMRCLQP